jgi:hypothetical protein
MHRRLVQDKEAWWLDLPRLHSRTGRWAFMYGEALKGF